MRSLFLLTAVALAGCAANDGPARQEALAAAEPDAIETDIQLPGWSQDLIDELSEIYADDQAEIAALTGVEFIAA